MLKGPKRSFVVVVVVVSKVYLIHKHTLNTYIEISQNIRLILKRVPEN